MAYKQISPQVVSEGGTGASTLTDHGVLVGSGTSSISATAVGTSGQVLTSNGAGSDPTFQAAAGGITGPVSSTDNALSRWNGTGGDTLQDSTVIVSDAGAITGAASINFGDDSLSNYDEGTFTPVLEFGGASTGITYTTQTGVYTRIGNLVYYNIYILLSNKGSATGAARITGLPFTSAATPGNTLNWFLKNPTGVSSSTSLYNDIAASSTSMALNFYNTVSGNAANLTNTHFGNTEQMFINAFYFV